MADSTSSPEPTSPEIALGMLIARKIFEKRGNHSEVHLNEMELAAFLALAAEQAFVVAYASTQKLQALTQWQCVECGGVSTGTTCSCGGGPAYPKH